MYKRLTQLQKDYVGLTQSLIFINTFLIAFTLIIYSNAVGANGLVIKEYLAAAYGLILVLPFIGRLNKQYPMQCLMVSIVMEFICIGGYIYSVYDSSALYVLFFSTFMLLSANLLSRGMNTKVGSYVIDGCDDFSNFITSVSAACTGLSALFGLVIMYYDVSNTTILIGLIISLIISRHYKMRVFRVVYQRKVGKA